MKLTTQVTAFLAIVMVLPFAQAQQSTSTTTAASTEGSTTASLSEAKKEAAPKFGGSLNSWMTAPVTATNHGEGTVEALQWLDLNYKVGEKTKIGMRKYMLHHFPTDRAERIAAEADGEAADPATTLEQTMIYTSTSLGKINDTDSVPLVVRLDLGDGYTYQKLDIQARLWAIIDIPYTINKKWSVGYTAVPYVYFFGQNREKSGITSLAQENPTKGRYIQQAYVGYNLTDSISFQQLAGFDTRFDTEYFNKAKETYELETAVNWNATDKLSLTASIMNSFLNTEQSYLSFYDEEDNTYSLVATMRF